MFADLNHAALHWQEQGHHHHDDGTHHLEDSSESAQHLAADHLGSSLAIAAMTSHQFPALGATVPGGLRHARAPNPTLDGLLRPPRSRG